MPKKIIRVGDTVNRRGGSFVAYVVTAVNESKKTAVIKNTKGEALGLYRNVPWSELAVLDESQNAARIVNEATEDR